MFEYLLLYFLNNKLKLPYLLCRQHKPIQILQEHSIVLRLHMVQLSMVLPFILNHFLYSEMKSKLFEERNSHMCIISILTK